MLKIYLTIIILFNVLLMTGQQMIGITPYAGSLSGIPKGAEKTLEHKLMQLVTQNGFGSTSGEFFLTCNVLVVNKAAIPTVPVQFSVDLEVSFYLVNAVEQVIIDEYPVNVSGLESNETKAVIQALNLINPRNPKLRKFMTDCRDKLVAYYAARVPVLISKAQSLANKEQYEEAMAVLGTIPECIDEYPVVADLSSKVYVKMLDRDAVLAINKAKTALAQKKYDEAFDLINSVNPASTHANRAYTMIDTIKNSLDAQEQAQYSERMRLAAEQKETAAKLYSDSVTLEKMRIDAAKKVSIAQADAQAKEASPQILNNLSSWLFGKLKK